MSACAASLEGPFSIPMRDWKIQALGGAWGDDLFSIPMRDWKSMADQNPRLQIEFSIPMWDWKATSLSDRVSALAVQHPHKGLEGHRPRPVTAPGMGSAPP